MSPFTRREFVAMALALGAEAAWCSPFSKESAVAWTERRDLFPEGVASGDPDSTSVLLWTRHPVKDATSSKLTVEVAEDVAFKRVIATKSVPILAESDWTCRLLVGRPSASPRLLLPLHEREG
jgi:alkaline phosphatase D